MREAYESEAHRALTRAGLSSVRALCEEVGILTSGVAPLWRSLGLEGAGAQAGS